MKLSTLAALAASRLREFSEVLFEVFQMAPLALAYYALFWLYSIHGHKRFEAAVQPYAIVHDKATSYIGTLTPKPAWLVC